MRTNDQHKRYERLADGQDARVGGHERAPAMRWSDAYDELGVGQRFHSGERAVAECDVIGFCALTGDWHPQHCDSRWAERSSFGERIAHGMLVLSLAVGLVPLDPERVLALRRVDEVVFKRPVRLGDRIHVEGELTRRRAIDDHVGLIDFKWRIRNQDGALVCSAAVQVLWKRESGAVARAEKEFWHDQIVPATAPGDFIPVPL
jgi:acyl dehydratase